MKVLPIGEGLVPDLVPNEWGGAYDVRMYVCLFQDRATTTKTFIYIKIPQTTLCITYKVKTVVVVVVVAVVAVVVVVAAVVVVVVVVVLHIPPPPLPLPEREQREFQGPAEPACDCPHAGVPQQELDVDRYAHGAQEGLQVGHCPADTQECHRDERFR